MRTPKGSGRGDFLTVLYTDGMGLAASCLWGRFRTVFRDDRTCRKSRCAIPVLLHATHSFSVPSAERRPALKPHVVENVAEVSSRFHKLVF
jgi:hypothetical protein